jgi:hypothetical protein
MVFHQAFDLPFVKDSTIRPTFDRAYLRIWLSLSAVENLPYSLARETATSASNFEALLMLLAIQQYSCYVPPV